VHKSIIVLMVSLGPLTSMLYNSLDALSLAAKKFIEYNQIIVQLIIIKSRFTARYINELVGCLFQS